MTGQNNMLACKVCREDEGIVTTQTQLNQCIQIVGAAFEILGIKGIHKIDRIEINLKNPEFFEKIAISRQKHPSVQYEAITQKNSRLFGIVRSVDISVRLLVFYNFVEF